MVTKKKKIDFTDQSIQDLMQETYHEAVDLRHRALSAYKKFTKNTEENTDIAMVGKITNDLLKIADNSIEKKLRLLKLQIDVVYKNGKGNEDGEDGSGGSGVLTEEDRKMVEDMLKRGGFDGEDENTKNYE